MDLELDHVFICTDAGAPEANLLIDFGLTEGSSNVHPGQGTSNRRFFFHNAMLELIWVHDPAEARSALTAPTKLWERWNGRQYNASPFGIAARPIAGGEAALAFEGWHYRPRYLPEDRTIFVADNSQTLHEPMLFYLAFAGRPEAQNREPLQHAAGFREITSLRVELSSAPLSQAAKAVSKIRGITLDTADNPMMKIGFDEEKSGQLKDFRPNLPLLFKW